MTLPDYDRYTQCGMVMTEKQGGSDLRANSTQAVAAVGGGKVPELTGHKWFCTHPVFGMFFTLAQAPGGITCFVAERPHPGFRLQRLKDKLGGRCLASSEVEYEELPARILGEEGRGIAVDGDADQLHAARHPARGRRNDPPRRGRGDLARPPPMAFGARLADHPAMKAVLADLALESEAAMTAAMRIARSYDSDDELPFRRLAPAVMKYYVAQALGGQRRPRRSSAWAATATPRTSSRRRCTATRRSGPSGRARATSRRSTCCARSTRSPSRSTRSSPSASSRAAAIRRSTRIWTRSASSSSPTRGKRAAPSRRSRSRCRPASSSATRPRRCRTPSAHPAWATAGSPSARFPHAEADTIIERTLEI